MRDSYSSNLTKCDNIEKGNIQRTSSHDCHVFIETLLFVAFNLLLIVLNPIIEISHFFKDLCSMTLKDVSLRRLDENILLILCKLERVFTHAFFDSMKYLHIHFSYEAWLCKWIYPLKDDNP